MGAEGVKWVSNNSSPTLTRYHGAPTTNVLYSPVSQAAATSYFNALAPWGLMGRVSMRPDGSVASRCPVGQTSLQVAANWGDNCYSDTDTTGNEQKVVYVPQFCYYIDTLTANQVWFWVGQIGDTFRLSNDSADHTFTSADIQPAFIENSVVKNSMFVGAYEAYYNSTTAKLESIAGRTPSDNITPANFRAYAANINPQWTMMTIQALAALQILIIIEYASLDSQSTLGYGNSGATATLKNTGATGSTGVNRGNASYGNTGDYTTEMSYRGIEQLWGNMYKYLDGANKAITTDHIWIKDYPPYSDAITTVAGYTDTGGVVPQTLTTYWTKPNTTLLALGLFMPDSTDPGDVTQTHYFCDPWINLTGSTRTLYYSGNIGAAFLSGIFMLGTKTGANATWGTRLQYHPQ